MNIKSILLTVSLTALVTGSAFFLPLFSGAPGFCGQQYFARPDRGRSIGGTGDYLLESPMDPTEIYDEPGKSKMGMDLVPVYADEVSDSKGTADRKIIYWKAPMEPTEIYDAPGKSKMGMDLVPVYEDEVQGGVDIKINPVVQQNMGLKIRPVEQGRLNHTIRTYGHVTFDETRTGIVSPKAAGWIETLYANYIGFVVEKGDPLYTIYSPALVATQEEYLSAFRNYQAQKNAPEPGPALIR